MELLSHRACVPPALLDNAQLFSKMYQFTLPPAVTENSEYSTSLPKIDGWAFSSQRLGTRWSFYPGAFSCPCFLIILLILIILFSYYLANSRWSLRTLPPGNLPWPLISGLCAPRHTPIAGYIVPFITCSTLYCNFLLTCLSYPLPTYIPDWGVPEGRGVFWSNAVHGTE